MTVFLWKARNHEACMGLPYKNISDDDFKILTHWITMFIVPMSVFGKKSTEQNCQLLLFRTYYVAYRIVCESATWSKWSFEVEYKIRFIVCYMSPGVEDKEQLQAEGKLDYQGRPSLPDRGQCHFDICMQSFCFKRDQIQILKQNLPFPHCHTVDVNIMLQHHAITQKTRNSLSMCQSSARWYEQ